MALKEILEFDDAWTITIAPAIGLPDESVTVPETVAVATSATVAVVVPAATTATVARPASPLSREADT